MTRLLVSVRSADEAECALAGGADLVDVKEPTHGSLGRADDEVVDDVVRRVAGRRPVSAAVGELHSWNETLPSTGLAFLKWGLAGCGGNAGWRDDLSALAVRVAREMPSCGLVAVAYADWRLAEAPEPDEVCAFASSNSSVLLLDTWRKDGATLLDWLSCQTMERLCRECRGAGVAVALAGSLGQSEIMALRMLRADWIAVRGAACVEGDRTGGIVVERVRELKEQLLLRNCGAFVVAPKGPRARAPVWRSAANDVHVDGANLPGSAGVSIVRRLSPAEMEALIQTHGVEFSLVYRIGPGRNGGAGTYWLHSGTIDSVRVPYAADVRWISHTHPPGRPLRASGFAHDGFLGDQDVLEWLQRYYGSPQRSSLIVPVGDQPFRFSVTDPRLP